MGKVRNKGSWFVVLLLLGVFSMRASLAFPAPLVIDRDGQWGFARSLMEKGEYEKATGEFERFIHFFPNDQQVPTAHLFIGICYLRIKRYESARDVFYEIARTEPADATTGKALFLIGESYYLQGVSGEAEKYYLQVIEKFPESELKNAALYRLGWARMQSAKWEEASATFGKVEGGRFYDSARDLSAESLNGTTLPYKSPAVAGTLAGLLPGLGHVYVGRYKDGTVAFLLNGLFIWAAVESFQNDLEVLGGILAFVELGWYAGNIYSAVNVTHKYNRKLQSDFLNSLKDELNLHFFSGRGGHTGLALTWRF